MDIDAAAVKLARSHNLASLRERLGKLSEQPEVQAQVLVAAAGHGLNCNTQTFHGLLARSGAVLDPQAVGTMLALGSVRESLQGADWRTREANFHGPFFQLSALVKLLGEGGTALLSLTESFDAFTQCVVEITLAAQGLLKVARIDAVSRDEFLRVLLTFSFYDQFIPLGTAIWGEALMAEMAALVPSLPEGENLSSPKRFGEGWEALSPDIAAHILSRGYWRELPNAVALLERHPGELRPSLLACAELWLERLSGGVRYGGHGAMIVYLGLQRSGGVDARYRVLMDVSGYSPPDVALIQEAILALSLEEREHIALQNFPISRLYSPCAPTDAVIGRAIAEILTWKKKPSIYHVHDATRIIFPAWGATAGPALMAALDGSRAPQTSLLIGLLAELKLAESAAVFDRYLDHKQTREAAATGLAGLGEAVAEPLAEASLSARKKDRRVGAAMVLSLLPPSSSIQDIAKARLTKERAEDVIALLKPLVS